MLLRQWQINWICEEKKTLRPNSDKVSQGHFLIEKLHAKNSVNPNKNCD